MDFTWLGPYSMSWQYCPHNFGGERIFFCFTDRNIKPVLCDFGHWILILEPENVSSSHAAGVAPFPQSSIWKPGWLCSSPAHCQLAPHSLGALLCTTCLFWLDFDNNSKCFMSTDSGPSSITNMLSMELQENLVRALLLFPFQVRKLRLQKVRRTDQGDLEQKLQSSD